MTTGPGREASHSSTVTCSVKGSDGALPGKGGVARGPANGLDEKSHSKDPVPIRGRPDPGGGTPSLLFKRKPIDGKPRAAIGGGAKGQLQGGGARVSDFNPFPGAT